MVGVIKLMWHESCKHFFNKVSCSYWLGLHNNFSIHKPTNVCLFGVSLIRAKSIPTPSLGLRPKPNSIAARPRPHASLGPTWTSDLNQSTSPRILAHSRSTVPREVETLLGITVSQLFSKSLGISMASTSAEVGTISKATLT